MHVPVMSSILQFAQKSFDYDLTSKALLKGCPSKSKPGSIHKSLKKAAQFCPTIFFPAFDGSSCTYIRKSGLWQRTQSGL